MKLTVHHNVVCLAEHRRRMQQRMADLTDTPVRIVLSEPSSCRRSHPAAQAMLGGLMQGLGEREKDPALIDAGKRLAEAAQKGHQDTSQRRWRPKWLRAMLWLAKGSRSS